MPTGMASGTRAQENLYNELLNNRWGIAISVLLTCSLVSQDDKGSDRNGRAGLEGEAARDPGGTDGGPREAGPAG